MTKISELIQMKEMTVKTFASDLKKFISYNTIKIPEGWKIKDAIKVDTKLLYQQLKQYIPTIVEVKISIIIANMGFESIKDYEKLGLVENNTTIFTLSQIKELLTALEKARVKAVSGYLPEMSKDGRETTTNYHTIMSESALIKEINILKKEILKLEASILKFNKKEFEMNDLPFN